MISAGSSFYLTAAYVRKYGIPCLNKKHIGIAVYISSCTAVAVITIITLLICGKTEAWNIMYPCPFIIILCFALPERWGCLWPFPG